MQQAFLKNIFLLLLANVLIKPIYILGIDAQVQNTVGDNEYGAYFAIFNFCFLFQIFLDCGIQNYNSQYLSRHRDQVEKQFGIVLSTRILLVPVFALATILFAFILGYESRYLTLFLGIGVIMSLQTGYVYLRSNFSALGQYRTETWLSALDKILMIAVVGYFIYVSNNISIERFIMGQVIALLISCVIALFLLSRRFKISFRFDHQASYSLIKKSWPFAVVFLLMTLYTRMDGVMLERLLDDNAKSAGVYATAYRLLDAANMFGYLFAVLLLPMFANLIGEKKDLNPLCMTATRLLFCLASVVSMACWYFTEPVLDLIYDDISLENVQTFRWLMVSFWAMAMSYIFGSMITASGELKIFNLIFIIGIVINWGLNLYLIPIYKAEGAAIATLITQFSVFIGQFMLAKKMFRLQYSGLFMVKTIGLLAILFVILHLLLGYVEAHWIIQLGIFIILSFIVSFLAGFLRFSTSHSA